METRHALITGAASGIGRAIAVRLAADSVDVLCADIDAVGLSGTVELVRSAGGRAEKAVLDVTDAAAIQALAETIDALDILVNNAAISDTTETRSLTPELLRRILNVNLLGAIDLALALRTLLARSSAGRLLTVASVQGLVGTRNSLAYATAKAGLLGFTRAFAADVAEDGVLVNALAPGFVDTPMAIIDGASEYDTDLFKQVYVEHRGIPLRRPSTAQEQAEIAAFLCSPANTYITAQTIIADGGMTSTFA